MPFAGEFDMPAIPPDFDSCARGRSCPRELHRRSDDKPEVIVRRMQEYEKQVIDNGV